MKKLFQIFIFFILMGVGSLHAGTRSNEIRDFLNTTGSRILELIGSDDEDEKFDALDEIFERDVNVSYMARFCLGRYYRMLSENEKETYHDLFKRYVKSIYKSYPLKFDPKDIRFEILDIKEGEKSAHAEVLITLPPEIQTEALKTVRVSFQIENKPTGGFWINDLQITEASMLMSLKNRFMTMMKDDEEEIEWFLDDLETLVTSNEKQIGVIPN